MAGGFTSSGSSRSQSAEDIEAELLKQKDWRYRVFTPLVLLILLTTVNLVNYIDRGIIAGAATSIQGCNDTFTWEHPDITNGTACDPDPQTSFCSSECDTTFANISKCGSQADPSEECCIEQTGFSINLTKIGFLQSAFMIGYVVSIAIFGILVGRCLPFRLIGIGLSIWCVSILFSGLFGPRFFNSYTGVLVARTFSGVGEASFQVVATPFIDDYAPVKSKSCWMAIFFTAIPAGTALGYVWAGAISGVLGWEWAFILEAPFMFPFAVLLFFMPHRMKNRKDEDEADTEDTTEKEKDKTTLGDDSSMKNPLLKTEESSSPEDAPTEEPSQLQAVLRDLAAVFKSPVCMLVIAGYSQYTACTSGFAFFAPKYIQTHKGKEWCQFGQLGADAIFGGIICVSGIVGTTVGGVVLDVFSRKLTGHSRLIEALKHTTIQSLLGMVLVLICSQMQNPFGFFALLGLGSACLFLTTAAVNIAIMASVPPESRAIAIAFSTVCIHVFGDVPSPIFIGLLSDHHGPQFTMIVMSVWVLWCVLFWGAAYVVSIACRPKKR